jgi:predicted deacylase
MPNSKLYQPMIFFVFLVAIHLFVWGSEDNTVFAIGDIVADPGEMASGFLTVPPKNDPGCKIPLTVINGKNKGKVLTLVAGVHGYEYPPILALYRLKRKIDPALLSGTLILVHIANPPGFEKRIIYYNPYDWKNLNRVFPGDPEGTSAQRIAHILVERIINKEMALAFGIKHIIIDNTRTKDISNSRYLGNTALLFGKPAITTESGYLGKTDEESIVRNIHGIFSVMRLIEMIEGQPAFVEEPVWIDKYEVVYSESSGLFYPLTEMGYHVEEGEKVGYVMDMLGETKTVYRAPFSGILLYVIHTPPICEGEPLFEVGQIKKSDSRRPGR